MNRSAAFTTVLCVTCALLSCGGGDHEAALTGPVTLYGGFFRENQSLALAIFSGGRIYGFYQSDFTGPERPAYVYNGFFVASAAKGNDAADLYRGQDFNFDKKEAIRVDVKLSHEGNDWVFGNVSRPSGSEDAFGASYSSASIEPTRVSSLPGAYAGQFRSLTGSSTLKATLGASGELSAETPGGCQISGKLTARPVGNLYDADVTLRGSCEGLSGRYQGPASQSFLTRNVFVMLTTEQLGNGIFLHLFDEM